MTTETADLPNVLHCSTSLVAHVLCVRDGTSKEEIEAWINREDPTGIESDWQLDDEKDPVQCPDYDDRKHILVSC